MRLRSLSALLCMAWLLAACVVVVPAPTPTPAPTETSVPPTATPTMPPPTATATPASAAASVPAMTTTATAWPELWRRSFVPVGGAVTQYLPGSLATWRDTFFIVSSQGVLYQIGLETGALLWQLPLWPEGARGGAGGRVSVMGDRALVGLSDLYMEGPSARSASFRSRLVLLDIPARQVVRDFGTVRNNGFDWLVSGTRALIRSTPIGGLVALDVPSGQVLWRSADAMLLGADGQTFYVSRSPSAFVPYNDANYLTRQTVLALDAATGAVRWQSNPPLNDFLRQAIIAGDRLIVMGDLRDVVALSLDGGREVWRLPVSLWTYYNTTADDQHLYGALGTGDALAAFRLTDGVQVWQAPLARGMLPSLFAREGRLYYFTYDYDTAQLALHTLDAATGQSAETVTLGPLADPSYYLHIHMVAGRWLVMGREVMVFGAGQPVGALEAVSPVTLAKQPVPPLPLYVESARSGAGNIWRALSDGTTFVNISNSGDPDWDPAPSPDGQWIAFESYRTGASEIWRMRSDGAEPQQLTHTNDPNVYNAHPTWSADGEHLAFASNRSGEHQIWAMRRDGSEPRMLTDTGRNVDPAWSPDGATIAFISNRLGQNDLWLMDADGGNPRPLVADDRAKSLPAWSPDGAHIAYVRHAPETGEAWGEIIIVDVATGLQWAAPYTAWGQDRNPAFAPDGTRLAWARRTDDPGKPQVWVARLDALESPSVIADAKDPVWLP